MGAILLPKTCIAGPSPKAEEALVSEADVEIDSLITTANTSIKPDDFLGAEKAWKNILNLAKLRNKKPAMAFAMGMLGNVISNQDRHKEALEYTQAASDLYAKIGEKHNQATSLLVIGTIQSNLGDYSSSLNAFQAARELSAKIGDRKGEMKGLNGLSFIYGVVGDLAQAERCAEEGVAIAKALGDRESEAQAWHSLSIAYDEIGDYARAMEYSQMDLRASQELKDRSSEAWALNAIGILHTNMGESEEAVKSLERSLALNPWRGGWINLADAYMAGKIPKQGCELYWKVGHGIGKGRCELLRKYHHAAIRFLQDGLESAEEVLENSSLLARYSGLGLAHEGLKRYEASFQYYLKGQKLLERTREGLSESRRLHYLAGNDWLFPRLEPYEGAVRVSEFLQEGVRDSLYYAEFTKSRIFTEAAARRYGRPGSKLSLKRMEAERRLNQEIASLLHGMDAAFLSRDTPARKSLEAELEAKKKEQAVFVARLRQEYPEYAAVRYPRPVHAEEISLRPDEILIEYEVTEPYSKAFVVKGGKVVLSYDLRLSRKELQALVRQYRGYFEGIVQSSQLSAYVPETALRLFDILLKPAFAATKDGKPVIPRSAKIIIIPDEILSLLPFESLAVSIPERLQMPAGKFGPAPLGIKYVAEEYDIAYYHSATALTAQRTLKRRVKPTRELLVVADPVFNVSDSRIKGTALAKVPLNDRRVQVQRGFIRAMGLGGAHTGLLESKTTATEDAFIFPRLDQTSVLSNALAGKVFPRQAVDVLSGVNANEKALKGLDISQYRYLVVATHGILDGTVPGVLEPALVLNQLGTDAENDGFLTMSEVMGLDLRADIVALTACQTGVGKYATGEGVMGMGRAFQYAGARDVLVSLWSVAENSTTLLGERFFRHVKEGNSPRRSLRLAREDIRREGYEHPYYWAPFILIGE